MPGIPTARGTPPGRGDALSSSLFTYSFGFRRHWWVISASAAREASKGKARGTSLLTRGRRSVTRGLLPSWESVSRQTRLWDDCSLGGWFSQEAAYPGFARRPLRKKFCQIVPKLLTLHNIMLKPPGVIKQRNLVAKQGFQGLGGPGSPGQGLTGRKEKPGNFFK